MALYSYWVILSLNRPTRMSFFDNDRDALINSTPLVSHFVDFLQSIPLGWLGRHNWASLNFRHTSTVICTPEATFRLIKHFSHSCLSYCLEKGNVLRGLIFSDRERRRPPLINNQSLARSALRSRLPQEESVPQREASIIPHSRGWQKQVFPSSDISAEGKWNSLQTSVS